MSQKIKILTIDDEKDICSLIKVTLEMIDPNMEVDFSTDAKKGLSMAMSNPPHLILLDVNMPKMTGLEILKKLKESDKTSTIPVIMVTGEGDEETKLKATELYNEDYIVKPFDAQTLKNSIDKVLRRSGLKA